MPAEEPCRGLRGLGLKEAQTDVNLGSGGHASWSRHLTSPDALGTGGRGAEPRAERGLGALRSLAETACRGLRPFPAFQPT